MPQSSWYPARQEVKSGHEEGLGHLREIQTSENGICNGDGYRRMPASGQVVEDLQQLYGKRIAPFHLPIQGKRDSLSAMSTWLVQQRARRWTDKGEL